jgi:hypothetical protein
LLARLMRPISLHLAMASSSQIALQMSSTCELSNWNCMAFPRFGYVALPAASDAQRPLNTTQYKG